MNSSPDGIKSWYVIQVWRTLMATCIFVAALVFVYLVLFPINPNFQGSKLFGLIPLFVAMLFRRTVFLGGCKLNFQRQELIRWWGLFFPLNKMRIPFEDIDTVMIAGGTASKIDGKTWYQVFVQRYDRYLVVRLDQREQESRAFANEIAKLLRVPLLDQTVNQRTA